MLLTDFDPASFLRDHWQQQPLLIRNPWQRWSNPLEPDELAGLACESEVESRLVVHTAGSWLLEHGPFAPERFAALGTADWTLLVQAVDHHVPEVAALLEPFRFIPNWRIDDVMVSYAADGGGVGPHFDQYDVFLIQGLGRRRWQVGGFCDQTAALLPHEELRLLARFEAQQEWVLEPGDILYLPPRIAHNGVAVGGDCMTYSIGFRAPARSELIAAWCDEAMAGLREDDRYGDAGLPMQDNPGEITAQALERLRVLIAERLDDRAAFARAVGKHVSAPRNPEIDWRPDEPIGLAALRRAAGSGATLQRNPASRFSFVSQAGDALLLFVDGGCFECSGDVAIFARQLCAYDRVEVPQGATKAVLELLTELYNAGSVAFSD